MTIVFYDGECGLCQRSIQFLYKKDKKKKLQFAKLNGVIYKNYYGNNSVCNNTLKLLYREKTFIKSTAVLKLCSILGAPYNILTIFFFTPVFIRDKIYDLIASNRKSYFCTLISKELLNDKRFLD